MNVCEGEPCDLGKTSLVLLHDRMLVVARPFLAACGSAVVSFKSLALHIAPQLWADENDSLQIRE